MRAQVRLDLAAGRECKGRGRTKRDEPPERSGRGTRGALAPGVPLQRAMAGLLPGLRRDASARHRRDGIGRPAANAGTLLIDERGQCWDLVSFLGAQTDEEVDVQVFLGKRERLPVRLIARRVSP